MGVCVTSWCTRCVVHMYVCVMGVCVRHVVVCMVYPHWQAFMRGKIKVKGNMGIAMKLGKVLDAARPKSKL